MNEAFSNSKIDSLPEWIHFEYDETGNRRYLHLGRKINGKYLPVGVLSLPQAEQLLTVLLKVCPSVLEDATIGARLKAIQDLVNEQAEDEGLWFIAYHITEDYLQQALRKLHATIEGEK